MYWRSRAVIPLTLLVALVLGCRPRADHRAPATTVDVAGVIDEQDTGLELEGAWQLVEADGAYGERCAWAPPNPTVPNEFGYTMYDSSLSAYARVRPALSQPGTYELFAHWCALPERITGGEPLATSAEIQVHPTRGRVAYTPVQANMASAGWHSLGSFYLEKDGFLLVSNLAGPNNGAVVVDAFRFEFRTPVRLDEAGATPPVAPPQPSPTP